MLKHLDFVFSKLRKGHALEKAVEVSPATLIDIIKKSGLKGRGGAGFPTGQKWEVTAKSENASKFIVCNADEGEPGTFKDRKIIEECCYKLIEAMVIAAYAIGSQQGFIYIRGEYSYLLKKLFDEINYYKKMNLLGEDILGKRGFNFEIEIRVGAGAYICGEETSLLESLEGKRGEPRNKPPFPVEKGFQNNPTVINNVETLIYIPHIVLEGASWFKNIGTEYSSGLKLFSVSGDCSKPGIYEFEFGITIHELLKEVGAPENTKAVQIGGAGGFCMSNKDFDKHLCFEGVPTGGSIIIFGENRNMLNVLLNFAEFFISESCGQCTPCREGSYRIHENLKKFEDGKGNSRVINDLQNLCNTMSLASKCGLGQSIPNSFRTITEKFKDEILTGIVT